MGETAPFWRFSAAAYPDLDKAQPNDVLSSNPTNSFTWNSNGSINGSMISSSKVYMSWTIIVFMINFVRSFNILNRYGICLLCKLLLAINLLHFKIKSHISSWIIYLINFLFLIEGWCISCGALQWWLSQSSSWCSLGCYLWWWCKALGWHIQDPHTHVAVLHAIYWQFISLKNK